MKRIEDLTPDEIEVITEFAELTDENKMKVLEYARYLLTAPAKGFLTPDEWIARYQ